ncbi:energy transducer TonB [Candidatus Symbiopectobacterium sp. 'North America']|uniref:energy transducer TonB n=1 Tax=Candidatus Symbiopectobacterium sp. 'North America' TaxID=2794574 RepID=UPI0018CB632C|nr:energy transducer TonB [Candidatus Symbiopectobacterium sp. 'North America']MBG6246315.1 energy transducer TonB [Candidatus Symbiopectobacterium sp. 'North America']
MYCLYRSRHAISWLPLPVVAACLMVMTQQSSLKVQPQYDDSVMELSLADLTPPAPPEAVVSPEPETPPEETLPELEPEPVKTPEPIVEAPPPKPEPKPEPKPKPVPKPKLVPVPRPASVATSVKAAVAKATASAPVVPTPAPPKVNAQALENSYIQALRGQIEQLKRYPTGRQASLERPEGNVEIWLEVDRNGRVLNSGINQKATSMLLNRAATSTLQSITQVRPFPAEAFAGQNTKRFLATFYYQAQ